MDLCPDDPSESSSGSAQWPAVFTDSGSPRRPRGLPDDGVTETSAVEVQMGSLGCAAEAEKYDFSLSKPY